MKAHRRAFLLAGLTAASGLAQAPGLRRVACLSGGWSDKDLLAAMARHGWVEGRNLHVATLVSRAELSAADHERNAQALTRERPEVVVTNNRDRVNAVLKAIPLVPVVALLHDPVFEGFAKSIARPGGRVTGVSFDSTRGGELAFWLLGTVVPGLRRIHALGAAAQHREPLVVETRRRSAEATGVTFVEHVVEDNASAYRVLASIRNPREEAMVVAAEIDHAAFANRAQRARVATVDMTGHLDSGYLMTAETRHADMWGSIATVVAQVLRGANPADVPFVLPTHVEVAVNRKAAAASGIAIPERVLLRATHIVD